MLFSVEIRRAWPCLGALVLVVILSLVVSVTYEVQRRIAPDVEDFDLKVARDDSNLLFAAVVFRHGVKNPRGSYKNDPYADGSAYVGGLSALSLQGKRQMYKFGERLRHRYLALIPQFYNPEHVYMLSSDFDHCLMSAEIVLAALYPPVPSERIHPHLDWQPIPVHTVPKDLDGVVLSILVNCPRYSEALQCVYEQPELAEINSSDIMQFFDERSDQTYMNLALAETLLGTLYSQKSLGLGVPEMFDEQTMLRLEDVAIAFQAAYTKTPFMRKIIGGPLIEEIRTRMEEKSAGSSKLDLFLVSGHDITLINLLRALGFTERPLHPEFGASLLIELHKVGQEYQVQVWFDNAFKPDSTYELLKLPFCDSLCPLSTFLEQTKYLVTSTWQQDCTSGPPDPDACS